jgi:hypothetical protein
MNEQIRDRLLALRQVGWKVALSTTRAPLPSLIVERYPWVPPEVLDAVAEIHDACSADDKAWILSASDYAGASGSAFAWNEWERVTLTAAGEDDPWKEEIRVFWDRHFPLLLSVKSGYAYFAIERDTSFIVVGEEPEFEATALVADSLAELLRMIGARSAKVERWC